MTALAPFRHPVTGLRAIGFGRRGPIWPVMGGSQPITTNGPTPPAQAVIPAAPATPPAVPPATPPVQPPATGDSGFPANTPLTEMTLDQQVAYWRHHSRAHENTAKARADYDAVKAKAAQYDALQAASMTDNEKAVADAEKRGRDAAIREVGGQLVDAQVIALSAGRMADGQRDALLGGLDRSKYLKADGSVDADKVRALVDGLAPATPQVPGTGTTGAPAVPAAPSLGQGTRQGSPVPSVADGEALYRQLFPGSDPAKATT